MCQFILFLLLCINSESTIVFIVSKQFIGTNLWHHENDSQQEDSWFETVSLTVGFDAFPVLMWARVLPHTVQRHVSCMLC